MKYINDAILVIAGDGPLKEELTQQAEKMCKEKQCECIKFIGAKTHEQLRSIYASSDIFVMPSITAKDGDKEGFGLVMLEAFASGLPVIASRSGGIVDLVKDRINGCLVEEKDIKGIANKINIVLNNERIYNKLVMAARSTAEQYDYKVIAKKYNDFIDKVIKE